MGRKKKQEQLDLIDVHPENSKAILACARRYQDAQETRVEALADEVAEKKKLLELIKAGGIKPDSEGKISFHLDGYKITVVPRDELVKVKADEEPE